MLGVPIFHVNGEDPRAVAAAVELAVEWRQPTTATS
jgi:2-oxoglutarate dehydrogenase complex dehydrogenase (E1) component-like enzyme